MWLRAEAAPGLPGSFIQLSHRIVDEAAPVIATVPAIDQEVWSDVHLLLLELLGYQSDALVVS